MRKVFIWNIILQEAQAEKYISDAIDVSNKNYTFLMSYLIDANLKENDDIVVITSFTKGGSAELNYELFKNEVMTITTKREAKVEFIPIVQETEFDSSSFNLFFKQVAAQIKDNDRIYLDITFGMKPYTLSMFTALAYVTKVARNVEVETIVYGQKYNGVVDIDKAEYTTIYDLTTLFYLNKIAGELNEGDREAADRMLDILLR